MSKETIHSFFELFDFRSTATWLETYAGFYIAYHWQAFYVTFFVDEKLIEQNYHMLKNEYIAHFFISSQSWTDWSFYLGIIIPAIYAAIFIWVLPNLLFIHAFNSARDYKLKKKIRIAQDAQDLLDEQKKIAVSTKKIVEAELDTAKAEKEKQELNPNKQKEEEYKSFIEEYAGAAFTLRRIRDAYYKHHGHYNQYIEDGIYVNPTITDEDIARADTNGLITLLPDNTFDLTKKGKDFIRNVL